MMVLMIKRKGGRVASLVILLVFLFAASLLLFFSLLRPSSLSVVAALSWVAGAAFSLLLLKPERIRSAIPRWGNSEQPGLERQSGDRSAEESEVAASPPARGVPFRPESSLPGSLPPSGPGEQSSRPPEEAIIRERERIAQELHSYAAQPLAHSLFLLNLYDQEKREEDLQGVRKGIKEAVGEIRVTIHNLRNEEPWPLLPSLHDLIGQFKEKLGIPVKLTVRGEENHMAPRVKKYLLSFIEEALTNVFKHSAASEVELTLRLDTKSLDLSVHDNGRGIGGNGKPSVFDPGSPHHFGLKFMREKALDLGGEFNILSEPGGGTTLQLHLPRVTEKEEARA